MKKKKGVKQIVHVGGKMMGAGWIVHLPEKKRGVKWIVQVGNEIMITNKRS